jgi:transcriptional regulator with XRE-family HTH domain
MVVNIPFIGQYKSMSTNACAQLSKQIRYLRIKHNLTQEALAERAGISTKYLQSLEGKQPKVASILTLEKLAKGFDIPIWKLLKFK